jgi:hypothetical protein
MTTPTGRPRDEPPPATVPRDPYGPDPAGVPDPMPTELQDTGAADEAFDDTDPMAGDAPTG